MGEVRKPFRSVLMSITAKSRMALDVGWRKTFKERGELKRVSKAVALAFVLVLQTASFGTTVVCAQGDDSFGFNISHTLSSGSAYMTGPRVAASGDNVYVVWSDVVWSDSVQSEIFFKVSRNRGVSFEDKINLSNDPGRSIHPQIAVSGNIVYVVWINAAPVWPGSLTVVRAGIDDGDGVSFGNPRVIEWHLAGSLIYDDYFDLAVFDGTLYMFSQGDEGLFLVRIARSYDAVYFEEQLITRDPNISLVLGRSGIRMAKWGNYIYVAWINGWLEYDQQKKPFWRFFGVRFARSTNNGADFEPMQILVDLTQEANEALEPVMIDNLTVGSWFFVDIDIAASGSNVYVVTSVYLGKYYWARSSVLLSISRDYGENFIEPNDYLATSPSYSGRPRIDAFGKNVYVVWEDGFGGNVDVWLAASADEGANFRLVKLSSGGGYALLPDMAIGFDPELGVIVNVVWTTVYHEYSAPGVIASRKIYAFFSRVTDNGASFTTIELTDKGTTFNVDVAAVSDIVYVVWAEGFELHPPYGNIEILFKTNAVGTPDDLELLDVTPVQAVFDPIILVEGKKTLLRLEIRNTFSRPIDAEIKLDCQSVQSGEIISQDVITETVSVKPGLKEYYLPLSRFIEPRGEVFHATATIDPDNTIEEANETNNVKASPSVIVKSTRKFTVLYVPLNVTRDGVPIGMNEVPDWQSMKSFVDDSSRFIEGTYPISEENYEAIYTSIPFQVDVPGEPRYFKTDDFRTYLTDDGVTYVLVKLQETALYGLPYIHHIVGVVRAGWFRDTTTIEEGIAMRGIALENTGWSGPAILEQHAAAVMTAHEIAHNLGWVPDDFPLGDQENPGHLSPAIVATGYWVAQREPVGPVSDFMVATVSGDDWISWLTFNFLLKKLKADPLDPDPTVILMRGVVFEDNTTVLDPWYKLNGTADVQLGSAGEFKVQYLDVGGNVLAEAGFNISNTLSEGNAPTQNFGPFSLRIPDLAGTTKIILKRGDQILAERAISPNSPQVRVASPNGGENFQQGDMVQVTWEGSDSDGDTLTYAVSLSVDNGTSWVPLALDLTDKEFSFTIPPKLDSDSALIRITATDGINTAEDTSDSTFKIVTFRIVEVKIVDGIIHNLSNNPGDSTGHQIAASGNNISVTWQDYTYGSTDILYRRSTDGGASFDPTINLSNNSDYSVYSRIAMSGNNVYVVWRDRTPGQNDLFFRRSTDGGASFEPTINLSNSTDDAQYPTIAVSGSNVYLVWQEDHMHFRRSTDGGASFEPAVSISPERSYWPSRIAVSGNNVYVGWTEDANIFFRRSTDGGASFEPTINLSSFGTSSLEHLIASGGNVYVLWTNSTSPYVYTILFSRSTDNGASFEPAINLSRFWTGSSTPQMAASGNNVYVVLTNQTPSGYVGQKWYPGTRDVLFRRSTDGGASFEPAITLTRPPVQNFGTPTSPRPRIAASGNNVYVVWMDEVWVNDLWLMTDIFLRVSTDGGASFDPAIFNLSNDVGDSANPRIATSGNKVYVVWDQDVGMWNGTALGGDIFFFSGSVLGPNKPPVADAGPDQTVAEGTSITLDGTASYDPDAHLLSYSWTQIAGPTVELRYTDSATPTFTAPFVDNQTLLTFQLTVNDGMIDSAPSVVNITVNTLPPVTQLDDEIISLIKHIINRPPIAIAGPDQTVNPESLVVLLGGAIDLDRDALSYLWTQTGGPPVTLSDAHNSTPSFTAPLVTEQTLLTFQLIVNDGLEDSNIATVNITVNPLTIDNPPTANAGPDQTVNEDTPVTFDGSGSSDDVGITGYTWTFTDGEPKTLNGIQPSYTFYTPRIYTVTLNVSDAAGNWATDTVIITVLDITKPVANAGPDQTVNVGATVNFDASASSDNVGIVSYEWNFGDETTGTGKTTTHTYTSPGNYTVTLTVKDTAGNTATDTAVITVRSLQGEPIPLWVVGTIIGASGAAILIPLLFWKGRKKKCAYDGKAITGEPHYETIIGKQYAFHNKECADAYKKKKH